jgi:DNA-binding FadR family transcriptional regulator
VAQLIAQHLDDNGLGPGDSLPSTRELAQRFDVSIPVVREAIAELAGRGRLLRSQGRPTVARAPSASELQAVFAATLPQGADRARQLLEYRRSLLAGAVRQATRCCRATDIERLRALLDDLAGTPSDPDLLRRAAIRLHRAIIEVAGNELILLTVDAVDAMLLDVDVELWDRRRHEAAGISHSVTALGSMITAMAEGKQRRAQRLMHDHLDQDDESVGGG